MMLLVNPQRSPAPEEHALLWGRSRRYYVSSFPGPLSVKTVLSGTASWTTDEGRHQLGESSYLVVNDGHPYTIEIEAREPVETFCVFFARGFVEAAARATEDSETSLLDDPGFSGRPLRLREVLQARGGAVDTSLARLRDLVGTPGSKAVTGEEDVLAALALALLGEQKTASFHHRRVDAVKAATRDEIFRRLCVARDALEGSLDQSLPLQDLGRLASLSPFHLHRHFRRTFGETPQAYRTRRRLERAASALRTSSTPVTEVALDAGFSSLGSFSSLFKRRFGISPLRYRLQKEQD